MYKRQEEARKRAEEERKRRIEEVKPKNDYPIGHPKFWQDISTEALLEGDKEYSQWQDRDAMWLSR